MKKLLKLALSLNSLRKAIGFFALLRAKDFDFHRQIIGKPNFKKVLVLSPHPDDDVFGLGGTLAKIAQNKGQIKIIYFCNGAAGGVESAKIDLKLVDIRQKESVASGKILGIFDQEFWRINDNELLENADLAIEKLKYLIKDYSPEVIFLPSLNDNHPDHVATGYILDQVLKTVPFSGEIWGYEVWTPTWANRIISIEEVLDKKLKAIEAHKSQLEARGYKEAILGLNRYRAEINHLTGYAEGFWATDAEIYKKLFKIRN